MDPHNPWQQPDPHGGPGQPPPGQPYPPQQPYGQPQPQYPPQQYPGQQHAAQPQYPAQQYPAPQYPPAQYPQQYPAQPSAAQPYSALPYTAQPYSAPPAYQQTSAPPVQPGPPGLLGPPGVPDAPRRNRWFAALVISAGLLVVVTIAVVVVAMNRKPGNNTATPQSSAAGPVDPCLIGKWKQTSYQHNVDLSTTDVGKREKLGTIKFTGGGTQWTINADGSAVEDNAKTSYSGKASDNRTVTATWEGKTEWKLSTKDGILSQAGGEATSAITITVDGAAKGRIELQPNRDPGPYSCTGDIWRTSTKDSADDFARYDRVK